MEPPNVPEKKYTLSVCALFKNEAPFLKEWIEYHRLIGVDHFYLYNNESLDLYKKALQPYLKQGVVTLVHWPDNLGPRVNQSATWSLSTQLSAYENAIKWTAWGRTKWLLFLNIDEFLVVPGSEKLATILARYDAYPGIALSRAHYDASQRSALPQKKWVIESLDIVAPGEEDLCRSVAKMILKPELCTSFIWPPYQCRFENDAQPAKIGKNELRVNHYENRMNFRKIGNIKKPLSVDSRALSEQEIDDYLRKGYEIKDSDQAAYRYVSELMKKMGLEEPLK
jgi:hypothetical protein